MRHPFERYPTNPTIEIPGFPGTDLTVLTPDEFAAAFNYVNDVEYEYGGSPPDDLDAEIRQAIQLSHTLDLVLRTLPECNAEFGRGVYTALSETPDNIYRSQPGIWIASLVRVDHDHGVRLWDHLLRDEDFHVRHETVSSTDLRNAVESVVMGHDDEANQQLTALGINSREALDLFRSYEGAQHGENLHVLGDRARHQHRVPEFGRAALHKLVNMTSASGAR